jgi:ribosomal-protein-alanine N-acetyltransferase
MAASPPLLTPRLRIEPFSTDRHLSDRYVGWLNDPEVVKFSEQRARVHTVDSCRVYALSFVGGPHHFWAIVAEELGHIGNLNAYVNQVHGTADVGILIGERSAQGRGYATEAWVAVCDYLLRTAGLRKVTAGALAVNQPMIRLMERVGMRDDGRRVRQQIWNGAEVDVVHAALFRAEWLERFPGQITSFSMRT